MATKTYVQSRSVDSDFGAPIINSKMRRLENGLYEASTTINGVTVTAQGRYEGAAAENLSTLVQEMNVEGKLAGIYN